MGNSYTPDGADHDYYRRPQDGMEPQRSVPSRSARQDSVQVIEDGAGPDAGAVRGGAGTGGSTRETTAPRHTEPAGSPSDSLPVWRRVNLALAAAWGLVAVMLGLGVGWLTGAFSAPQYYDPSGNQTAESASVISMNLYSMGPFLFLFGMIGAFTLLTVQAAGFRRKQR